ncbi:MAG: tetratricopeptide repeat protein [Deltaproteobacteria bacterium]|nr:tetratricopeptide repeat protein [Deltaproteobacteria bacterium]MBW2531783.1 tetratricopeptide repeat protein [Deltaproteobacteria bacterium]
MIDRDTLLREAREDLLRSRFAQAKQRYREVLEADKLDVDALAGMTRVSLAEGKFREARDHADRVLAEQPEHVEAKILRLVAIEAEGDPRTALAEMRKVADRHPSSCLASYHVGRLLAAAGNGEQSLPWLERAFEQADRARHRYAIMNLIGYVQQDLGRLGDAVRSHQRAVDISAKRTEAYVALAEALTRGDDVDASLTILDEAERKIGEHSDLQRKRAELLAGRGDLTGARQAAQRVCDRHPDDGSAWLMLSRLAMASGDFLAAEQAATRSRNAEPGAWQPHFQLGLAFDARDDSEQAEAAYREALALAPSSWHPANNLGLVLLARGTEAAASEAAELFAQATKMAGPGELGPRFNSALALARLADKTAECRKLCQQLLARELPEPQRAKLEALLAELG